MNELLKNIKKLFLEKLQLKTGWGRNEIIRAYQQSVNEAILNQLNLPS